MRLFLGFIFFFFFAQPVKELVLLPPGLSSPCGPISDLVLTCCNWNEWRAFQGHGGREGKEKKRGGKKRWSTFALLWWSDGVWCVFSAVQLIAEQKFWPEQSERNYSFVCWSLSQLSGGEKQGPAWTGRQPIAGLTHTHTHTHTHTDNHSSSQSHLWPILCWSIPACLWTGVGGNPSAWRKARHAQEEEACAEP